MLTFDDLYVNVESVPDKTIVRVVARCPSVSVIEVDMSLIDNEVSTGQAVSHAKMEAKAALMHKLYGEQGVMLDRLEAAHRAVVEAQVQLAHTNYSYYERDAQALRDAEFLYSQAVLNMRHEIQGD